MRNIYIYIYNQCFRPNKINFSKILNKFDKFYNDANVIKTIMINKIKLLLT